MIFYVRMNHMRQDNNIFPPDLHFGRKRVWLSNGLRMIHIVFYGICFALIISESLSLCGSRPVRTKVTKHPCCSTDSVRQLSIAIDWLNVPFFLNNCCFMLFLSLNLGTWAQDLPQNVSRQRCQLQMTKWSSSVDSGLSFVCQHVRPAIQWETDRMSTWVDRVVHWNGSLQVNRELCGHTGIK